MSSRFTTRNRYPKSNCATWATKSFSSSPPVRVEVNGGRRLTHCPLARLPEFPLVIPESPQRDPHARRMRAGCDRRAGPTSHSEIDGVPTILDLVADGAGHALLSSPAVASANRPGAYEVRQITHPPPVARLQLATSSQRASTNGRSRKQAAFSRICCATACAGSDGHGWAPLHGKPSDASEP